MCFFKGTHFREEFGAGSFKWKKREGHTLVELVVVIVIVSVLTGIIGVSVDGINENTRLFNAVNLALSDIRFAHELAMTHRCEVDVVVTPAADRYEVKWHATGLYVSSPLDGGDLIVNFNQGEYSDVSITDSGLNGPLSFNSIGEPLINGATFAGETSVMLLNSKMLIVVYPSGYVCIKETEGGGGC